VCVLSVAQGYLKLWFPDRKKYKNHIVKVIEERNVMFPEYVAHILVGLETHVANKMIILK
jgi:hypothetical protein